MYVIVRTTGDIVNAVYGPFDEQGASRAYKALRALGYTAGENALVVRGLLAVDHEAAAQAVIEDQRRRMEVSA